MIFFDQIKHSNYSEYITTKLNLKDQTIHVPDQQDLEERKNIIQYVYEEDFPKLDHRQKKIFQIKMDCAINEIDTHYPFVLDEKLENDFFSYLTEPLFNLPTNTPLLKRTTSLSTTFYFFPNLLVKDSGLEKVISDIKVDTSKSFQAPQISESVTTTIVSSLGIGIVKGIGGKIGAEIFNKIFPPGVPSYFGDVYKEITKIVHKEVTEVIINQVDGEINGVQAWVKDTYIPRKNSKVSRKQLSDLLTPFVNKLYTEATYTLMEPEFQNPGFSVFLVASLMHLNLIQEQALVDPDQKDPTKSSFAQTVRKNARTYSNYIEKVYPIIMKERLDAITIKEVTRNMNDPSKSGTWRPFMVTFHYVSDEILNYHGHEYKRGSKHHENEAVNKALKAYKKNIKVDFANKLGDPDKVNSEIIILIDKPIPTSSSFTLKLKQMVIRFAIFVQKMWPFQKSGK